MLAAVALGIGEKFEEATAQQVVCLERSVGGHRLGEADSDRDRLHLVYEAWKMSNLVVLSCSFRNLVTNLLEELDVTATKDELVRP